MDQTIDQLGEKLNPRNLLDNLLDAFRGGETSSTGQNVTQSLQKAGVTVKRAVGEHPVPALLTAAGALWWLFDSANDHDRSYDSVDYDGPDVIPAWEDGYQWEGSAFASEDDWNTRADRVLQDLSRETQSSSTYSSEQLRDVATKTFALSGYKRSDLHRYRPAQSVATHPHWDSLQSLDSIASDHESSDDDDTISQKVSATWESIKSTAADTKKSSKEKLRAISKSLTDYANQTGSTAKTWGSAAAERATELSEAARTRTAETARYAREHSQFVGQKIKEGADVATERVRQTADEHPLAVAAACYGIGLAAGLLLPSTRFEDELVGDTSDEVTEEAKAKVEEVLEHGKEVAAETVSAAMTEAERQGLTPEKIGEKTQEAVTNVAEAGREAASDVKKSAKDVATSAGEVAEAGKQAAREKAEKKASQV